jgi:hypothetical protein
MNNMQQTRQVFGLTTTVGYVDGQAIHFAMTDTGTFAALSNDAIDMSAWDALNDDERAALCDDVRNGGFKGFCRKEGV